MFESVKTVLFADFILLCLQLGTKIACSETTINISLFVKCIFDLEMQSLELVTDFEPILL